MKYLSRQTQLLIVSGFVSALLLQAGVGYMSYRGIMDYRENTRWTAHTRDVLKGLSRILLHLREAESASRGYLITGNSARLAASHAAGQAFADEIAAVRSLTADNAEQQRNFDLLDPLAETRLRLLEVSRAAAVKDQPGAIQAGEAMTARIYERVEAMTTLENALLDQRAQYARSAGDRVVWIIIAGSGISLALLLVAFWLLRGEVTRRGAAQRKANDAAHFMDSVIRNLPIMVFVKDARDLRFVRFNRAGEVLLGLPEQALLGRNDYDLFSREEADAFTAKDREVLARGALVDIPEESIHASNGEVRLLHTRKVPVYDADGRALYLLGISEDITERRRVELAMARLNDDLLQRGTQLEAANKELEGFAYSVSHDLRTPLRAIAGYAQMLDEDYGARLDDEGRRLLDVVRNSTVRMGALIDDLLAFSRLSRAALSVMPIDMVSLAQGAWAEVASGGVDLPRPDMESLPDAYGDSRLLKQVWINLLSNAAKFSNSSKQPLIEVGGEQRGKETVYWVRDNGVGFDMQYYNKLFGVFQRLHSAEQFPGTGVGLAIVQRVIARHGGRVWAESRPGSGATFFFALPDKEKTDGGHEGS